MPSAADPRWLARTRAPRGTSSLTRANDADLVAGYLQDAARYPGGHTREVCFPENEADVAALVREARPLLIVGAQSSLTGGATPHGETVVSTARLAAMRDWTGSSVCAGAGVVLRDLDAACIERGLYFPPVPTYDGATVGGVVSTDAAGAATFKHGTVRRWVDRLTLVLACGEVLDVERGRISAHPDGWFEIARLDGSCMRVPVPTVAVPAVAKVSAGYRGGAGMDLIDLFIGSEGTLGVVTEARLRLGPRPSWLAVLVPVAGDAEAISLTRALRDEGQRTRRAAATRHGGDSIDGAESGADVAAIEYMDARSLEILREDGIAERCGVPLPPGARALLLVQLELPPSYDRARAVKELAEASGSEDLAEASGSEDLAKASGSEELTEASGSASSAARRPIATLCRILERHGLLADAVPALPGEDDRRRALFALREAVPDGVNRRIREAALRTGQAISKSGGDVIVPFEHLEESLVRYRAVLEATGIDSVIWGHISDGNVHPNLIAKSSQEMEIARAAQIAIGRIAIELGGSPLAEHGTGRNPGKKLLLRELHGEAGVESMRATRRALDPDGLFAPGVLFDDA